MDCNTHEDILFSPGPLPEEYEIREGSADFTGRICVIGSELKEDALKELFEV